MEGHKPAKCNPASLQAMAVNIMCEPSSECTKFGGNAVLCFLTSIYDGWFAINGWRYDLNFGIQLILIREENLH